MQKEADAGLNLEFLWGGGGGRGGGGISDP